MKKIRVAMLGSYLKPGGVAVHTQKLAKYLSYHEDIELYIITIGNKHRQFKKDNLNIHEINELLPFPFSIPTIVWFLRREIIEINPDIVHAQGSSFPYSTVATFFQNKYPTLLTVHSIVAKELEFHSGFNFILGALLHKPNERYVLSKISNIIVCSPKMKDLVANMTNAKIHVIPNGIDFDDIRNVQPDKSIKYPSILYVGRLHKIKGIDVLLNAVPKLMEKMQHLHIYITGSGPEEGNLKKLVKTLNIEENVKFLGFASNGQKYPYYKSADVCVFPSLYETFGIVLLEAMALGKPIVASNVGGIPFLVEHGKNGLLFDCGNVEDLAEKTRILLENKELREKMGKTGKEMVKKFSWEIIAERTIAMYKEILSKRDQ